MDVIYWLIPSMLIVGIVMVVLLVIAIRSGQFDDLEGESARILFDEDDGQSKDAIKKNKKQ